MPYIKQLPTFNWLFEQKKLPNYQNEKDKYTAWPVTNIKQT